MHLSRLVPVIFLAPSPSFLLQVYIMAGSNLSLSHLLPVIFLGAKPSFSSAESALSCLVPIIFLGLKPSFSSASFYMMG